MVFLHLHMLIYVPMLFCGWPPQWHRGTGVKVFKRISSSQSIVLSVMPFSREELHRGSACSIVSLLKPTETLNELLSSRFVLFDYPFVKLASPVSSRFLFFTQRAILGTVEQ